MLKITESRTLTGTAKVDGTTVVSMSAVLNSDNVGNTSYTEIISNQELYRLNVKELREDIGQFKEEVYKVEDEFLANGNPLDETLPEELPEIEPETEA